MLGKLVFPQKTKIPAAVCHVASIGEYIVSCSIYRHSVDSSSSSSSLTRHRKSVDSEEEVMGSKGPRSIMKKETSSPGFNRNISFAEEAEVAQVV